MTLDPTPPPFGPASRKPRPTTGPGGEWLKIVLMGCALASVLFVTLFWQPPGGIVETGEPRVRIDATPVPELDSAILAQALDSTRTDRLVTDREPFGHLLEKSLRVTPAVARKLNMPQQAVPIALLRRNPDRYRGQYLWYKGKLEYLSAAKPGHPVPSYSYYEGRLRTTEGEPVVFAFSVPPRETLQVGDWVRMEGYFMKLRDAHLPAPLDQAPMLVGPELFPAYPDWEAIEKLDPAVLARIEDGTWNEQAKDFEGAFDIDKLLSDSQDVPLWHLASYALHRSETVSDEEWRKVPAFVTEDQFEAFRTGSVERGAPMRILGTFIEARVLPAKVNPLGFESWSEVWMQVRDLGGKTIPVWIPRAVRPDWKRNEPVVCHAYFFRLYRYPTRDRQLRWTPLFVAAGLEPFELSGDALRNPITLAVGSMISVVGLFLFFVARRDRRMRKHHEKQLVERRRRRRDKTDGPVPQQPCTS